MSIRARIIYWTDWHDQRQSNASGSNLNALSASDLFIKGNHLEAKCLKITQSSSWLYGPRFSRRIRKIAIRLAYSAYWVPKIPLPRVKFMFWCSHGTLGEERWGGLPPAKTWERWLPLSLIVSSPNGVRRERERERLSSGQDGRMTRKYQNIAWEAWILCWPFFIYRSGRIFSWMNSACMRDTHIHMRTHSPDQEFLSGGCHSEWLLF